MTPKSSIAATSIPHPHVSREDSQLPPRNICEIVKLDSEHNGRPDDQGLEHIEHAQQSTDGTHKSLFLNLSAELRNEIYMLVLTHIPTRYQRLNQEDPGSILVPAADYGTQSQRLEYRGLSIPYNTAILNVNRQIHSEATPVLYGCNLFKVYGHGDLSKFLRTIGSSVIHLRNVDIRGRLGESRLPEILHALRPAIGLVSLRFPVLTWKYIDAEIMAKELSLFIEAQNKAREAGTDPLPVDFFKFKEIDRDPGMAYDAKVKALLSSDPKK